MATAKRQSALAAGAASALVALTGVVDASAPAPPPRRAREVHDRNHVRIEPSTITPRWQNSSTFW